MNKKAVTPYELAQVIGEDAASKANEAFFGRRYYFGKRARVSEFESIEARNLEIRRLSLMCVPHSRLADDFGLSEKRIRDIVNYRADVED